MKKITLTINKKKYDFHFGLGFLGKALEDLDLDINELSLKLTKNPFYYAPKLMFYSYEYGCLRKEKESISYDVFVDLLDKDNSFANGNIESFLAGFTNSLTKDVPKEKEAKVTKKK